MKKISITDFKKIMSEHNQWLLDHNKGKQAIFKDVVFEKGNFTDCNFELTEFKNCKFFDCVFCKGTFNKSLISNCYMSNVKFEKISLTNITINETHFNNCTYYNSLFFGANFNKVTFLNTHFFESLINAKSTDVKVDTITSNSIKQNKKNTPVNISIDLNAINFINTVFKIMKEKEGEE